MELMEYRVLKEARDVWLVNWDEEALSNGRWNGLPSMLEPEEIIKDYLFIPITFHIFSVLDVPGLLPLASRGSVESVRPMGNPLSGEPPGKRLFGPNPPGGGGSHDDDPAVPSLPKICPIPPASACSKKRRIMSLNVGTRVWLLSWL